MSTLAELQAKGLCLTLFPEGVTPVLRASGTRTVAASVLSYTMDLSQLDMSSLASCVFDSSISGSIYGYMGSSGTLGGRGFPFSPLGVDAYGGYDSPFKGRAKSIYNSSGLNYRVWDAYHLFVIPKIVEITMPAPTPLVSDFETSKLLDPRYINLYDAKMEALPGGSATLIESGAIAASGAMASCAYKSGYIIVLVRARVKTDYAESVGPIYRRRPWHFDNTTTLGDSAPSYSSQRTGEPPNYWSCVAKKMWFYTAEVSGSVFSSVSLLGTLGNDIEDRASSLWYSPLPTSPLFVPSWVQRHYFSGDSTFPALSNGVSTSNKVIHASLPASVTYQMNQEGSSVTALSPEGSPIQKVFKVGTDIGCRAVMTSEGVALQDVPSTKVAELMFQEDPSGSNKEFRAATPYCASRSRYPRCLPGLSLAFFKQRRESEGPR